MGNGPQGEGVASGGSESAPSSPHIGAHHSGVDCPFASLSPSLRPTRTYYCFLYMVGLKTRMNDRCINKWRDGQSLRGGSCREAKRQRAPPLPTGRVGSGPARLLEGLPLPAPGHNHPPPPAVSPPTSPGWPHVLLECDNRLNSLWPRWKAKRP